MLLPILTLSYIFSHAKECSFSVELLQLQDASGSFQPYIEKMQSITMDLIKALNDKYETFHMGLAGFVDKPIPFRGLGNFGANTYASDWCYRLFRPMTNNVTAIENALGDLLWNMGVGGDLPENPLEALIFGALDNAVGWTDYYEASRDTGASKDTGASTDTGVSRDTDPFRHNAPRRDNVVRIILLVTDDKAHQPTEADDGTARGWNWPRTYPNGPSGTSEGGFGAHSFSSSNLFADGDKYIRMADLFRIFDNNLTMMTSEEYSELLDLIEYFGPYPWPKIQPHPGDASQPECQLTEYPSLEQTGYVLQTQNVLPIFLVPEDGRDLIGYYTGIAQQLGVLSVVAPMDLDSIFENIVEAITTMTQAVCEAPSTSPHPRPPTTTTTPHIPLTNPPVIVPTRPTTIPTTDTPPPQTTTMMITSSMEIQSNSDILVSTAATQTNTSMGETSNLLYPLNETSTTSTYAPANPIPIDFTSTTEEEDDKAAAGVIIGATTGAIVGVGAVAGGVYAAVGTNFFSSTPMMENIDMNAADAPTEAVERERLEQVTMDMFH